MAGLSNAARVAGLGLVLLFLSASPTLGADPAPGETPRPPTCAERFPAEGPAGVDLRLGCIVSELVGLWRPDQASSPPTLSAYVIALTTLVVATVLLGVLAVRLLVRRAGRRLAPTTPQAWWVCPSCHSINGLESSRCYNCSTPMPTDASAAILPTSEEPATPQSFGRGKHG